MLSNDSTWSDVFSLFKGYSTLYECCLIFHGKTDNLKQDVLLAYRSIRCAFTSTDVTSRINEFDVELASRFENGCRLSPTHSNESEGDHAIFISWNKSQQDLQLDTLTNGNEILMYHGTSRDYCLNWIEYCTWDLKSYKEGQDFNTCNESAFYLQTDFDSAKKRGIGTKLKGKMSCVMVFTAKESYKTTKNYTELKGKKEWDDAVMDFRKDKTPKFLKKMHCIEGVMVNNPKDVSKGKTPTGAGRGGVQICIKTERFFEDNFRFLGLALYE
jgi:hypothetical protein